MNLGSKNELKRVFFDDRTKKSNIFETSTFFKSMKLIGLLFLLIVFSNFASTQVGMGKWRMHVSPYEALDVVEGNKTVYAALSKGLLEYDIESGEQSLRTAADYLSDISPTALGYDLNSKTVLIGYENGNLDFLQDERITNLPAILQSSINGVKRINSIVCKGNNAYLATGFGIVVINLQKREVRDTYNPTPMDESILDITFLNDSIYALTESGLYVGVESNDFLADPSQWSQVSSVIDYSASGIYNSIEAYENTLFLGYNDQLYGSDTLFRLVGNQWEVFLDEIELNGLNVSNNLLLASLEGGVVVFESNLTAQQTIYQYENTSFPRPNNAIFDGENFYISDNTYGLVKAKNAFESSQIIFEGPLFNLAYRADWNNGKLAVAAGGNSGTSPAFLQEGGYTMQDEEWISVNPNNQPILQGKNIWDFISVSVNPSDIEEVAFGTYSELPLVIMKNGAITDTFGYSNSLLTSLSGSGTTGVAKITDVCFDNNSNLWIANAESERPLKVRDENGTWFDFDLGNQVKNKGTRRLVIDDNDIKWMAIDGVGLVAFDHGENIDDASDDRYKVFTTSVNSGDLPTSTIDAIAVDFDNNIWIGTPEGMRVLYNSSNVFDASPGDYNFQKLLIEFGENVEIVLGTTQITDIEIDGANRKWIATANSGAFLLEPDGLDVVENFTSENSPLLNNNILDITIDQNNGEVYFVTNDGLISYRSDASQGDNNYTNVNVFPNPVRPDYFGPVTIQGIAYNSDVKITDMAGNLVFQTTSNGGTATWNGRTLQGERVQTGVYLIWTSIDNQDVKGRKVGKVVFIN